MDSDAAQRFIEARAAVDFGPVFTHAAYLLNLATHDDTLWERTIDALADELARGAMLGAEGVVTHVGSDRLQDRGRAAARIAEAIYRAFERVAPQDVQVRLLLENSAGAGNSYGSTVGELADVIERTGLGTGVLGICLDTCHAQAFGIPVDSEETWDCLLDSIKAEVGLERFDLVHANDCMFPLGSRRDRHAWIGDGTIGRQGFSAMFSATARCPELAGLCAITEMPGDPPDKDAENLRRLDELRGVSCSSHDV